MEDQYIIYTPNQQPRRHEFTIRPNGRKCVKRPKPIIYRKHKPDLLNPPTIYKGPGDVPDALWTRL